jgi:hypothetical protein
MRPIRAIIGRFLQGECEVKKRIVIARAPPRADVGDDSPEVFGKYLKAEVAKWAKVVAASGAKLD